MIEKWLTNLSGPEALAVALGAAMILGLAFLGALWVVFEIRDDVRHRRGRRQMMKTLREVTDENRREGGEQKWSGQSER